MALTSRRVPSTTGRTGTPPTSLLANAGRRPRRPRKTGHSTSNNGPAYEGGQSARRRRRNEPLMRGNRSLVSVVDDDESVRESLPDLLRLFGFAAEAFSSAEAFLASDVVSETSCLLLDIAMPGMSGLDLQQELTRRCQKIPIVFITGLADGSVRPRLFARGAVACLI